MAWLTLVASGVLEAVWATALGASDGLRKRKPTIVFFVSICLSFVGLAYAMTEIPTGTAYAVWVGIGAVGASIYPALAGKERLAPAKAAMLCVLVGSLIGLKVVA